MSVRLVDRDRDAPALAPAPREFRYWDNLERPRIARLRRIGRALLRFDPAPPAEVVGKLAAMYGDGDPIAAAVVAGGNAALALREAAKAPGSRQSEAPEPVTEFLRDVDEPPPWLDASLLERGALAFRRFGSTMFRFAGAITLAGYAENSVAQPLVRSGAYLGASTRRRFLETVDFWISVSEPGGLARGQRGYELALRVRMMHEGLRQKLLARGNWNTEAWGHPISTGDALLTLMGGSVAPAAAFYRLGILTSPRDIHALLHFWRYVGHLMGVRPRWFPRTWREVIQLGFVVMAKGAHLSGEDGRGLCQAYANAFSERGEGAWTERLAAAIDHRVHLGTTEFFLPRRVHRANQLPRAGVFVLAPLLSLPANLAGEVLRRPFPAIDAYLDRRRRRARHRWLERRRG